MPNSKFGSFLRSKYTSALTVVLLVQIGLFYSSQRGDSMPLAQPLSLFPKQIQSWQMLQEGVIEPDVQAVLKADDLLSRWYAGEEGGANLFIAYFQTQRAQQAPHSPKNCLPGSGWQRVSAEVIDVPIADSGETIQVNRYIVAKAENKSVVVYWYQSQSRVVADEFKARFYLVADSIRYHRSDTALIRIVVPVVNDNEAKATATATRFTQAIYPLLRRYLPS
jgi:EpsI family protein